MKYVLFLSKTLPNEQPLFFLYPASVDRDIFIKSLAYIKTNPQGLWGRDCKNIHSEGTIQANGKTSNKEDQVFWDDRFGDMTKGSTMKYVSFRRKGATDDDDRLTVIFSPFIDHDQLAKVAIARASHRNNDFILSSPLSAGFSGDSWHCFGSSLTMKLSSESIDSDITLKQFYHENVDILKAKKLWLQLGNIPVSDDGSDGHIEEDFLEFKKETPVYEVWDWFENEFNLSIHNDLMCMR